MFYHNREVKEFSLKYVSYGLDDFDHSSGFTYIDIDNDGDLDIIGNTTHEDLKVYKNNEVGNHSVIFELKDDLGNTNSIGCKIIIITDNGESKSRQIREIKASGGFLSFDAPYAHFGLGDETLVNKVAVIRSTGERIIFSKKFEAGYKYIINRNSIAEVSLE